MSPCWISRQDEWCRNGGVSGSERVGRRECQPPRRARPLCNKRRLRLPERYRSPQVVNSCIIIQTISFPTELDCDQQLYDHVLTSVIFWDPHSLEGHQMNSYVRSQTYGNNLALHAQETIPWAEIWILWIGNWIADKVGHLSRVKSLLKPAKKESDSVTAL